MKDNVSLQYPCSGALLSANRLSDEEEKKVGGGVSVTARFLLYCQAVHPAAVSCALLSVLRRHRVLSTGKGIDKAKGSLHIVEEDRDRKRRVR
jgi:hypothetical protein